MRRFLSEVWAAGLRKRSREVVMVAIGIALATVSAVDLAWSSWAGDNDRIAMASGSLTGALIVVAVGAILGWRKAENRNRGDIGHP
ncbi:hypothetical protein BMS3Bbin02_02185 [bacterium BMS3Bbin02]|nr:hypothetical protein BMS3Bbin02_02185 [bacterium BMS3Bbin02]HDH25287.1 hypothetical protein [Actinomycetota bacterium]